MLPIYISQEGSCSKKTAPSNLKHQIFESNRFENILFCLQTGISIVDQDFHIEWVNQKFRLFFPGKDPVGQTCCQLMRAVENPCENCPVHSSFLTGKVQRSIKYHPELQQWFVIITQPVLNSSGEIVKVITSLTDITQHKVTERNFQKIEKYFHFVIETARDFVIYRLAIYLHNYPSPKVVFLSPSAKNILGISDPEDFQSWIKNFHSSDIKRIIQAYKNRQKTLRLDEEYRIFNPQKGLWRWVHNVATTDIDAKTQTLYLNGVMIDTTERHEIRDELLKSKQHIQSIMDNAAGFVLYRLRTDEKEPYGLKMVDVSPSVKEILGISPENFKVSSYYDNLHPDDLPTVMETHKKALQTGKFEMTARVFNPVIEDYIWIYAITASVENEEDRTPYINGILLDVTEKRKAFEQLKQREKDLSYQAEKLNEMNSALNVLIEKRDQDKKELEKNIFRNINELILPEIEVLKTTSMTKRQIELIDTIELTLKDISSNFLSKLPIDNLRLSSSELNVANCIKQGKSSKEIASYLNVSIKTVKNHRVAIRKKLGITGKRINLYQYLSSMQ